MANQLTLTINDKEQLRAAYMPFIKHGGLFIATDKTCALGLQVTVSLKLWSEVADFIISGKVVWITPPYAQHQLPAGIGVQLDEQADGLRAKIAEHLYAG